MKTAVITGAMVAGIWLAGCGKPGGSTGSPDLPARPTALSNAAPPAATTNPATAAHPVAIPVFQPIIAAWQEGDKSAAVSRFQEADWSGRPIFAAGMVISFSEAQFSALSDADRQWKARELTVQLDLLKHLVEAVVQAGRDAAANGEVAQARKDFTSLKNFGLALDGPDHLRLVQIIGKVSKNMANTELAKLGK